MFDPTWRQRALASASDPFDLIVIGGGITGCGIFLDAAQRGLRVLLLERDDIASGTSSRSSKLIHGGLRYLKQMQFRITRLACRERDRMLSLSPHLIRPVQFLYPAYHGDQLPGWQVDLGLWMYDQLTSRPDRHTRVSMDELRTLAPGLPTEQLDRALAYWDAKADDARVTLAAAATGCAYGGYVLTRARVAEAIRDSRGRITGCVAEDLVNGTVLRLAAHVTVNASGVWTDEIRRVFGFQDRHLRPSRGSHLVLPADHIPLQAACTVPSPDDGRPVFLIPHSEGTLVGTTDLYHNEDLDDPRPSRTEVDYLLRTLNAAFPSTLTRLEHVRGAFAGLRPILDTYADDPSEASREEDIWYEHGLLSVAGGKLTTWRTTAEEAVDAVIERLPESRARHTEPCATKGTPLAGLAPRDLSERLKIVHGLQPVVADGMARRLGNLAWTACDLVTRQRDLQPLDDQADVTAAEIRAHLRYAAVVHLEDLLLRRVRLGLWDPDAAVALLPRLRPLLRTEMGWKSARITVEEERCIAQLQGWTVAGIREIGHSPRSAS